MENRDPRHLLTFIIPAVVTPYILIGMFCTFLSRFTHPVLGFISFGIISYFSYIHLPKKGMFYTGLIASFLTIYWLFHSYQVDLIWSLFWIAIYVSGSIWVFNWLSADLDNGGDPSEFMEGFKARLAKNFGVDGTSSPSPAKPKDSRLYHQKVGFCRGQNTLTTTNHSHQLIKCGRCNTAGCAELNCTNRNFQGTKCLTCDLNANAK